MPNWVYNACTATGDPTEIERFRERMIRDVRAQEEGFFGRKGEVIPVFDFGGIIPMPSEAFATNYENWAVENWGVKWNAQYLHVDRPDTNRIFFAFETPWSFPWPIFEALADEFPDLVFHVSAHEEGEAFAYEGHINGINDFGPVEPAAGKDLEDDEEGDETP